MADAANTVTLKPETIQGFEAYIREAEAEMEQTLNGPRFLWSDLVPDRAEQVRRGDCIAQLWSGSWPLSVAHGLIHDWIGAVAIPAATITGVLALLQDYDRHHEVYRPQVIDSKLLSRHGNDFQVHLRLLKKKIITAVLDTYHDVHYFPVDDRRWSCRSYTTRIAEVENAGKRNELVLLPDTGHGFLWRLYSYWRLCQTEDGVHVECRAISLTRDIPTGLAWVIGPIIGRLPQASLIATLEATRRGFATHHQATCSVVEAVPSQPDSPPVQH